MKHLPIYILSLFFLLACSSERKELFKETDAFIKSLEVFHESYGVVGGGNYSIFTSDGRYKITPFGGLIKIKIQENPNQKEYEELKIDIANYYQNDDRVRKVFVENSGLLLIDCRR
jgi:hypothetical protein